MSWSLFSAGHPPHPILAQLLIPEQSFLDKLLRSRSRSRLKWKSSSQSNPRWKYKSSSKTETFYRLNLKGKSTVFENIYQNLTFFEDIKNMWIKILRSFPIKSYEHIFGIKVNPSSFFGGATFLVSYFSPPLILQFLHELGVISSFFGGQINFVSRDYKS